MATEDDIAVVGLGCRFPGANNIEDYWKLLLNSENHIKEIPTDRWNVNDFYDEDPSVPGKAYVKRAALVKDYNEWDHRFYGLNEMEAEFVDPQHRMVLDCVHMALEDAGIRRKDIDGTNTAVYIGSMNNDFQNSVLMDYKIANNYTAVGIHNSIISARVAFVYNLFGPAITMDTACSSSLVTIHLGGQALKLGDCDAVICGGVNSITDPAQFVFLSKAKMLSPTGQSQPFSAAANGYARGEGCGIVILKRMKDAIRDGNKIWGVLKTGSNQDGHTATPITAPSGSQQTQLLERLYSKYEVDRKDIQVIEAHGTGTPVGDPVETNALGKFFSRPANATDKVYIGTVKSNIGHTEAAAGTAGLIKVLLMMKHGKVVPSLLDKQNINPKINFDSYGFEVPSDVTNWPRPAKSGRIACVNSFGFGGTNAHAIVQEYVPMPKDKTNKDENSSKFAYIVAMSALDETSLVENIKTFSQRLKEHQYDIDSLSYTSLVKRDHRPFRKAFVAESQEQLIDMCDAFISSPQIQPRQDKTKVAFVFCGVGTTWKGMCSFMMGVDVFRNAIQSIDELLLPLSGWTLSSKLSSSSEILADPMVGHVAIFGCQVGLVEVWKHFGISPDIVVGQSVGEVAAAYTSGSIDLASAVRVIYYRSKFLAEVKGGAMAVVKNVDTQKIENLCATTKGKLCIAVYNSSTSCTISGDKTEIDNVRTKLTNGLGAQGGILIDLDVTCAYHSPYVEEAADKATSFLKGLKRGSTRVQIISTVTGQEESPEMYSDPFYWRDNTRKPVRFRDAIKAAVSSTSKTVFLEIGPSPVLGAHIKNLFQNGNIPRVIPSMRKGNENTTICTAFCALFELGFDLKWERLSSTMPKTTAIPQYVFRSHIIPYKAPKSKPTSHMSFQRPAHLYLSQKVTNLNQEQFTIDVDMASTPFVFDHIVKGAVLIPGAFYADVGFSIGEGILNMQPNEASVSLEFTKTAKIEKDSATQLTVTTFGQSEDQVHFLAKQSGKIVVHGIVKRMTNKKTFEAKVDIENIRLNVLQTAHRKNDAKTLYSDLAKMGFEYGKCFQIMEKCIANDSGCVVDFQIPEDVFKDINTTTTHPCLLDGMLQTTLIAVDANTKTLIAEEDLILFPVAIQNIIVYRKPHRKHVVAYTMRTNTSILENAVKVHFNSILLNTDGTVIAEIRNFTTFSRRGSSFIPDELKYKLSWSKTQVRLQDKPLPRILMIDLTTDVKMKENIKEKEVLIVTPKETHISDETQFEQFLDVSVKSNLQLFEAVVVLFGNNEELCIDSESPHVIYNSSRNHCLSLLWLLRYFKDKEAPPMFITTQNTQSISTETAIFSLEKSETLNNLNGCEIWGFIRSVQTELINEKMTLVDLQPTFSIAKGTFFRFIANSIKSGESMQTEYVICNQSIFGVTFQKTEMTDVTPSLRLSNNSQDNCECTISSSDALKVQGLYKIVSDDGQKHESVGKDVMKLRVEHISRHPSEYFPITTTKQSGLPTEFQILEEGHTVFGLEYTGYGLEVKRSKVFQCPGQHMETSVAGPSSERWGLVAVYPTKIKTVVNVPRACTVSLREMPFYRPGLLFRAMVFWNMVQQTPSKSSVLLLSTTKDDKNVSLLETMLKTTKSAKIRTLHDKGRVDIILLLDYNTDVSNYGIEFFQSAKQIICLKTGISEGIQTILADNNHTKITEIDPKKVFSETVIKTVLPKVVSWLKKHYHQISFAQTSDRINESVIKVNSSKLLSKKPLHRLFDRKDVFIVTGGLTGLGWQLTMLLAELGVGIIATISRRGLNKETRTQIEDLQVKYNCSIVTFQGDVCKLESVQEMVYKLHRKYGRGMIKGVLHGAGVLESKLLLNLEPSHLDTVMKPKILGALNLHVATKSEQLECFILHSSITSFIGSPGQSNYGAANNFLDAFARWRRGQGLCAQSINWGALGVGMAARKEFVDNFVKRGHLLLSETEIRSCFLQALMQNSTEIVYANIDWKTFSKDFFIPQMSRVKLSMNALFAQKDIQPGAFVEQSEKSRFDITTIKKAERPSQLESLGKLVATTAKRIIGGDVGMVTMSSTFGQLGMDSMSAVTFSNVIYQETSVRIKQEIFLNFENSLADVVNLLDLSLFGKNTETQHRTEDHHHERL